MAKSKKLPPKQARFVEEYLDDLNATQAYIRAGYKTRGHGAEVEASKLLRKPEVQAAIQEGISKRSKRTQVAADKVLERLWAIATADPNELIEHRRVCCRQCHP